MSEEMLITAFVIMWLVSAEQFTDVGQLHCYRTVTVNDGVTYSHLVEPASSCGRADTMQ